MNDDLSRRGFLKLAAATAVSLGAASVVGPGMQRAVQAASTSAADVKAYAFVCGILKTQTQYLLKDTRVGSPFNIPVTFFVVRHGSDWVAFDTGNNAMVAKDPVEYWSKPVTDAYFPVMKDYEEFHIQLKKHLNIDPKDLKAAVISHGHLDHAGAIDNFKGTKVPLYFQKKELETIKKSVESGKKTAYIPDDFKVMKDLNIQAVDGILDLFGDKTVVAFPTPGHTEGHQSLLVKRTGSKPLVLAADAMYTIENMADAIPPGLAWDIPQSLQALHVFKVMNYIDADVVPSHDPDYWKTKPLAPQVYAIS